MREIRSLNSGWRFKPDFEAAYADPGADVSGWEPVDLPHSNLELPYDGFDERSFQFISAYARDIEVSPADAGRRAFLDFEGVMSACELWLGGERVGAHRGGFTPFSVEVTGRLRPGVNRLVIAVDSTERPDTPPFGDIVDYLCYGGIYREAWLRFQEGDYIRDLFARPERCLEPEKDVRVLVEVDSTGAAGGAAVEDLDGTLELRCELRPAIPGDGTRRGAATLAQAGPAPVNRRGEAGVPARTELWLEGVKGLAVWDLDSPALYELEAILSRGGLVLDRVAVRIGFREAEFRPGGFFLNGRRVTLVGLNRHQSYPYAGFAMPERVQRRDAEILKRELGLNIVRTSHYPQSRHFLDACDELGLLVLEEMPGWRHIGDAAWKDAACADVEAMVRRDRNRPSVALWGVRVDESPDDRDLYSRTNEIAHRLDPTRQTCGVRDLRGSEFLEDVYTYNDFVHSGGREALRKPRSVTGLRRPVPYLVTEHSGHMFPTRRSDGEERLAEHALRHARVLDAAFSTRGVSGAIGWCAFDYNTHKDFGSGDRICYHGVSDMFRVPKYAAALYASQAEPERVGYVLEAATLFAKGERAPKRLLPIEVYTNCEEVALYRSGRKIGTFKPDRPAFPGLPHPPVRVRDLVGDGLDDERLSARDRAMALRVAGLVFEGGFEAVGPLDRARLGLLLWRSGMTAAELESLVTRRFFGWGTEDDYFDVAGLVGGVEVVRRRYGADARYERLDMRADDAALDLPPGGGWDATRVTLRALDQYGNVFPYTPECAQLGVEGPARIIGPSRVALIGGVIAFWVRTVGRTGRIRVSAQGARHEAAPVEIEVRG